MAPFADNINHADVGVTHDIVNTDMHLKGDKHSSYFTHSKFMSDLTPLYEAHHEQVENEEKKEPKEESQIYGDMNELARIEGVYDHNMFEMN
jgi:hypothetical protein